MMKEGRDRMAGNVLDVGDNLVKLFTDTFKLVETIRHVPDAGGLRAQYRMLVVAIRPSVESSPRFHKRGAEASGTGRGGLQGKWLG